MSDDRLAVSTAGPTVPPGDEPEHGGGLHQPHRAQAVDVFFCTVRVPLDRLPDAQWVKLRRLAYQCATFGNAMLAAQYLKKKGFGDEVARVAYKQAGDVLAAAVRDAVSRECVGIWRRLGRKILRGEQALACFSADHALIVRDRGVRLLRHDDGTLHVRVRVEPQSTGGIDEDPTLAMALAVWMPAVHRDPWLRSRLDALLQDKAIKKATILFRRPGRKVFVRLTYATAGALATAGGQATFGPLRDDNTVWVRSEHRACSFTDRMDRLRHMKTHWAGIHRRLFQRFGKRGRRQDLRAALVKAGGFSAWAEGPLHQWSREIVTWCQREGVASLIWAIAEDGTLPWDRLAALTRYKCEDAGIAFSQLVASETPTDELRTDQNASLTQTSGKTGP